MLFALGDPLSFVVLLAAFVVSATLSGWGSALACGRVGVGEPGRGRPDPRRQLDPYGSVAAAIAGTGWHRPLEVPEQRRGGRVALAVLAGPLLVLALGLGALAGFGATYGGAPGTARLLQEGAGVLAPGEEAWLLAGLAATWTGVLQLVPLPPLPGGYALFAVAPRSPGWQRARYQLVDRNIGTAVVLALLLIPLGGPQAVLPAVLDQVVDPLVGAVSGA